MRQPLGTTKFLDRRSFIGGSEARIIMGADEAAAVRDRLLGEIEGLTSSDSAADWVRVALTTKNTLVETDAKNLEEAFERKVSTLVGGAAAHDRATPAHGSDPLVQILALSTLAPSAQAPAQQQPTE